RWLYPEMDGYHEIADFSLTRWKDHWCRIENNRFAEKNCRFCADPNNTWEHDHYTVLGEKAPGGLVSNIPCYVQHYRRANCCQWHPNGFLPLDEPQIIIEQVDLLPAQKRAIDQIEEQQIAWLQENPLVIELPVTAQLRIRQIT